MLLMGASNASRFGQLLADIVLKSVPMQLVLPDVLNAKFVSPAPGHKILPNLMNLETGRHNNRAACVTHRIEYHPNTFGFVICRVEFGPKPTDVVNYQRLEGWLMHRWRHSRISFLQDLRRPRALDSSLIEFCPRQAHRRFINSHDQLYLTGQVVRDNLRSLSICCEYAVVSDGYAWQGDEWYYDAN